MIKLLKAICTCSFLFYKYVTAGETKLKSYVLCRELRLQMLIIDSFIPREYLDIIDSNVAWNEDIGEWQLRLGFYYFL